MVSLLNMPNGTYETAPPNAVLADGPLLRRPLTFSLGRTLLDQPGCNYDRHSLYEKRLIFDAQNANASHPKRKSRDPRTERSVLQVRYDHFIMDTGVSERLAHTRNAARIQPSIGPDKWISYEGIWKRKGSSPPHTRPPDSQAYKHLRLFFVFGGQASCSGQHGIPS